MAETASPLARLCSNLDALQGRISAAAARSPRAPEHTMLLPVTKGRDPRVFDLLLEAGHREIGENRVLDARKRRADAPEGLVWHGIGHLQRNKVAVALETFDVFHALDSARLMDTIAPRLAARGRPWQVYLQVNAAEDSAKGGFPVDEALDALRALALAPGFEVLGFMTMAALGSSEGEVRRTFRTLAHLRDEAVRLGIGVRPPDGLSMGMSSDFEIAVEEGATLVRVGTAVFEGVLTSGVPGAPMVDPHARSEPPEPAAPANPFPAPPEEPRSPRESS